MPCYHPNRVYRISPEKVVFQSYYSPAPRYFTEEYVVPCGQCVYCRLNRARQMADRGLLELQSHDQSMFLTLTYDPEHVPTTFKTDPATGETSGLPVFTLNGRDFTLFMKRLRKYYEPKRLRFMACGEYGGETFRPHYHAIVFGLDPGDLTVLFKTHLGDILYDSKTIKELWGNGQITLAPANYSTIGYVCRYILKKQTGKDAHFYADNGLVPPFSRYSRRPGIGGLSYDLTRPAGSDIIVSTPTGGKTIRYPKYFLGKDEVYRPDEAEQVKEANLLRAVARVEAIEHELEIPYEVYLEQCERRHEDVSKGLLRRFTPCPNLGFSDP